MDWESIAFILTFAFELAVINGATGGSATLASPISRLRTTLGRIALRMIGFNQTARTQSLHLTLIQD